MEMGERIRMMRKECGLTQGELAQKLGLKDSAVAKYENGRVENIKRSTIQKMADIPERRGRAAPAECPPRGRPCRCASASRASDTDIRPCHGRSCR